MLTRADLNAAASNGYAIFIALVLVVGFILSLVYLPGWLADRKSWSEPIEKPDTGSDRQLLAALARRAGLDEVQR